MPYSPSSHADPQWLRVAPLAIEGVEVAINRYFYNHPEMVLGRWTRKDTLYGEGYSVTGNGDLAAPLGGYLMCHGAGGIAGHVRFGARTAAAPAIIGVTFLLLG